MRAVTFLSLVAGAFGLSAFPDCFDPHDSHYNYTQVGITPVNNCIQFTVSAGTGCAWMCNYCANQLGTFNYYFTDGVCTYQTGGCVGNPQTGKVYTCCSAS